MKRQKWKRKVKKDALFSPLDDQAAARRLGKTSAPLKRPREIAGDLPRKRQWKCRRTCTRVRSALPARCSQFRPPPRERLMADGGKHGRERSGERAPRSDRGNDIFLFALLSEMQIVRTVGLRNHAERTALVGSAGVVNSHSSWHGI